jgi:hypothetical protein
VHQPLNDDAERFRDYTAEHHRHHNRGRVFPDQQLSEPGIRKLLHHHGQIGAPAVLRLSLHPRQCQRQPADGLLGGAQRMYPAIAGSRAKLRRRDSTEGHVRAACPLVPAVSHSRLWSLATGLVRAGGHRLVGCWEASSSAQCMSGTPVPLTTVALLGGQSSDEGGLLRVLKKKGREQKSQPFRR